MGVPRLFPWILNKYPESVKHTNNSNFNFCNSIDVLLIDANPLLYITKMKIENDLKRRYKNDFETISKLFFEQIIHIIKITKPTKEVFIALDGVAPQAKQAQQRVRRYMSGPPDHINSDDEYTVDSLQFSPGTELMEYLNKYIKTKIKKEVKAHNPILRDLEIIYSSYRRPGEGEHKCIQYIRNHPYIKENHFTIYGPDGDLIWLTLGLNYLSPKQISIIREVPEEVSGYYYMNMTNIFNSMIKDDIKVNDLIFIASLVGNDFIEKIQMFIFLEDGLDFIISILRDSNLTLIKEYGNLITINIPDLYILVKQLADNQSIYLVNQTIKQKEHLEISIENNPNLIKLIDENINVDDMGKYPKKYYNRFGVKMLDRMKVCENYLQTLYFVNQYYMDNLPSWSFVYDYHYPPLMSDFASYLKNLSTTSKNYSYEFNYGKPSEPFVQLLSILPPWGSKYLPDIYKQVFDELKDSLDIDIYPEISDVIIDYRGKLNEYEGVIHLPSIDRVLVEKLYKKYTVNKYIRNKLIR